MPLFFVFLLPLVFAVTSTLQYCFPGDEYAMYCIGSVPAVWILLFAGNSIEIQSPLTAVCVAAAGAIPMALVGLAMDWLRVHRRTWAIAYAIGATLIFFSTIRSFPSIERAIGKNGSLWAYVFFAMNLSLYGSCALSIAIAGGQWLCSKRTRETQGT